MIGLIISTNYNAQATLSGVCAMIMACVKPLTVNYEMFMNPFATNLVKTAQINSWWYENTARIDPALRISSPQSAYISVVNVSSPLFFSLLTLCIRLSQIFVAPAQQCYTAASLEMTLYTYSEQRHL